ncbi:BCS1 N terminal-domain-containing protein [Biscogniauxia marginata]|nr:BCS1 N terminal-domain-containing protein [Biscogniauxia marginata]
MASTPILSSGPAESVSPHDNSDAPQSHQLALLDFFFPGISMIAGAIQKYLHIDLNLYIPIAIFAGALTLAWSYTSTYFWSQLETHFMSVVDIRTDDEIYSILMAWVAAQQFSRGARRFVVNTNTNSRFWYFWGWNDNEDNEGKHDDLEDKKKNLSYTPSFGTHHFWYHGRLLQFRRTSNRDQQSSSLASEREEISLSCFGRDPKILKQLLMEAREKYLEKDEKKTLIYRGTRGSSYSDMTWQRCMARTPRPFSTVILNENKKKDIIDDVTDYLCPATQRWYANRGIPYRRGYLLYGPPGTGKSSLSLALAGFFKMRIYIVSLNSMLSNEETLASLFAELPHRCVVLLEDIDTAGLTHTREEETESSDASDQQKTTSNKKTTNNSETPGRLSLSGLLNILDGVASQEGRVLIMTTNHINKLDKALIRPGRIDMSVEFGLADSEITSAVFRAIFAYLEGDDEPEPSTNLSLSPDAQKALEEEKVKERKAHDAQISVLAEEFASKIPALEFSPAELQGFLMRHKRNPRAAVENAEDFVERTRKDRKEKELKDAEDRRKAEEKKAEEEKKEQEAKTEVKNSEEDEKENGTQADVKDKPSTTEPLATDAKTSKEPAPTPNAEGPAPVKELQVETRVIQPPAKEELETETTGKTGHRRQDSGYATPTSGDP